MNIPSFQRRKIDSSNLQNVLKDMGIELTDKELEQLRKTLPTDGKPHKNVPFLPGTDLTGQHEQPLIF